MNDKKEIIYSLSLKIIKINLKVRFPCTLACSIKLDGQQRQIGGEKQLVNGQAVLNITYSTQLYLPNRKQNVSHDRKCTLFIYLKSSSGRIPAGSVSIPIAKAISQNLRQVTRVDKCPDKNALIEYEVKLQKHDDKKDNTNTSTLEKEGRASRNIKLIKSVSPDRTHQHKKIVTTSQIQTIRETSYLRRLASKKEDQSRSSIFDNYYPAERKPDSQKLFTLQREIQNYKSKIMMVQSELASKNNRYNQIQREMKHLQKKNEQLQLQAKSLSSKIQYGDKANKDLGLQMKQLKQKMEQQKLNYQNIIKRLQIRQNSCKEQIKTITEKLYSSQNQKQRMVFQKNIASNQFEAREKKIRQTFKDKQKKLLEQRSSLLKKIDGLQKDIQKCKEDSTQAKNKYSDNVQQIHELKLVVQNIATQRQRYRGQSNDLKFQLTKLKNQKHILEENLDSMGKFNEERRNFRKQLNQKDVQVSQIKDRITSLEAQITRLKNQNEQLQKGIRQKSNQLKNMQKDLNSLSKQNNTLQRDLADKQMKIQSLMQDLQLQMKRIKFYQAQIAELEEQYQSKQQAIERQLRQSSNYKTMLQQQVQKLQNQIEINNNQITVSMKDVQQLEQMIEEKNQEVENLQSQMIQINTLSQQWQMEKIELAEENKELKEKYQHLVEESQKQIRQINQNIASISQQAQKQAALLQNQLKEQKEKNILLKSQVKQKQEHIGSLTQSNFMLQKELEEAFAQKQALISKQESAHQEYKQQISNMKKEMDDKKQMIQSLEKYTQLQINELSKQNKTLQSNIKKLKDSSCKFQEEAYLSISILSSHLKQTSLKKEIIFSDQELSIKVNELLNQTILRNKQFYRNNKQKEEKINKLQQQVQALQEQHRSKHENLLTTSINLQLLKKSTNQYTDQIQNKNRKINQLTHLLKQKQNELLAVEQQQNQKIISLNAILVQKNIEIQQWKQRYEQLEQTLENSKAEVSCKNEQITKLQKQRKNMQVDHKSKITMLQSSLRGEIQKINALQHGKSQIQKQLRQQKQNLRKLMRELQNKCHQYDQQSLQLQQNQSLSKMKDTQIKKLKQSNAEYKIIFDAFFQSQPEFNPNQNPSNPKIQKYLNDPSMKQTQFLKQKARIFYQNYLNLITRSSQLNSKTSYLNASVQSLTQQLQNLQAQYQKDHNSYSIHLQEVKLEQIQNNKSRQKQYQVKIQLMKTFDDVRQNLDLLRKFIDELVKLIANFEKEKKISVFVITPVKQVMKKIDEQSGFLIKNMNTTFNKNKRQWDLASLRAKKNPSKKIETIINSMKSI